MPNKALRLTRLRLWVGGAILVFWFRVKLGCGRKVGGQLTQTVGLPEGFKIWSSFLRSHFSKSFRHNSRAGVFACSVALPAFRVLAVSVFGKRVLTEKSRFRFGWSCSQSGLQSGALFRRAGCVGGRLSSSGALCWRSRFLAKRFSTSSHFACEWLLFGVVFPHVERQPNPASS